MNPGILSSRSCNQTPLSGAALDASPAQTICERSLGIRRMVGTRAGMKCRRPWSSE